MTRPTPLTPPSSDLVLDRRRFLLASAAGVAATMLASCRRGGGGAEGRTVRLPRGATGFPSPFASNGDIGYSQMSLIYDTLLWKDGNGELLPWLARSVTSSADHLTYTFELREDVRWNDGRPLTADDVAFTFEYYAKQETLPPPVIIQPPPGIAHVRPTAPRTVEIVLTAPAVTFPEHVAGAVPIIPRHVWSSIDDPAAANDTKVLVGSGPYRLESYRGDGDPMLFVGRDDYFLGRPYVQRVQWLAIADQAHISALRSGQTDVARGAGLRDDTLAPLLRDPAFGMITDQGATTFPLYWNMGKEGALSDVRFRRACALAIDRQELVTRLAAGKGMPGNPGFLSPVNPYFAPVRQYELDVAGANALLDAAEYPVGTDGIRSDSRGRRLSFELLIDNFQAPLSEILVGALRRIGVELRPKHVEVGPQLFGNKFVGAYDLAVLFFPGPGPGGPNGDPDILRRLFSSEEPPSLQGASNYVNRTFDALAEQQLRTFDESERRAIVAQMQQILAEDLPVLPLYYPEIETIFRKRVLDQWYVTPGHFPVSEENKHLFVTGQKSGLEIRGDH